MQNATLIKTKFQAGLKETLGFFFIDIGSSEQFRGQMCVCDLESGLGTSNETWSRSLSLLLKHDIDEDFQICNMSVFFFLAVDWTVCIHSFNYFYKNYFSSDASISTVICFIPQLTSPQRDMFFLAWIWEEKVETRSCSPGWSRMEPSGLLSSASKCRDLRCVLP